MAKGKAVAVVEEEPDPVFELAAKPHTNLTAEERVKRNLKIAADRASGVPEAEVALEWGITTRGVRKIVAKYREQNPTLRNHDPVTIVDEVLEGYAADIAELVKAQKIAADQKNVNGWVGAINAKTALRQKSLELLQAINALPHDLGQMRVLMDGRLLSERVVGVLERHDMLTDEVLDELAALLPPPPGVLDDDDPEVVDAELVA